MVAPKVFALCGVLLPSTPPWSVLTLLCAATLRYSSLMFQVPLWTSTKAREYPLWSLRALSPPVRCCLPAPCLLPLCGCPCVCVLSCPSLCCPPLLVPAAPGLGAFSPFGSSLSFGRLSRVSSALRCSGLLPWAEFVFAFLGAINYCGPWRFPLLPLVSGPFSVFALPSVGVLFLGGVLVGPLSWLLWGVFVRGSRTRPEPWTGLHCSEFHWRWPVELPALRSRAPASSKACTHGSFSTDPVALRIWYFVMSTQHLCTLLRLFTDNLAHTALLQIALGRWHPDRFEQLCLAPSDEPYAFEDTAL